MVKSCCAVNCTNRADAALARSFHTFPADEDRRKAWVKAIRRVDPKTKNEWWPSNSSVICSDHFEPEDFRLDRGVTLLKPDAVPTRFNFSEFLTRRRFVLTAVGFVAHCFVQKFILSESKAVHKRPAVLRTSAVSAAALQPPPQPSTSASVSADAPSACDHTYAVSQSPRNLKRRCDDYLQQLSESKKALYNAQRREVRAKATVKKVLVDLENQRLLTTEAQRLLSAFQGIPVHLFAKSSAAYSEEQRQFATTLHFYSPKAYEFCRQTMKLPAEGTLRRWVSGIDYQPGFNHQVFQCLAEKATGPDAWQYKACSVMIDGMSIRKRIDWDSKQKKMVGFTDLGAGAIDNDSQSEATESLVIMAVGLLGHWKVTLGYFLITGVSATVQAQLIRTALIKLYTSGIRAMALVMDGLATNQAMVTELGGSLSPRSTLKSTFAHPANSSFLVYIFFDACHMLKVLRNALQALQQIVLPGVGTARWNDIVRLHELQHSEGLRAANKLTTAHIQFQQQKMKVRLAAQTLSASVGKALQFLEANNFPAFTNTHGTQRFVFCIDRLFDTFNSRSPKGTGYKQALTPASFRAVLPFLSETRDMLLNMTDVAGRKVCDGRRHMAALGFVVNIDSLVLMGNELLLSASPFHQKYILTYKLSQDHLELYFGCIRRMGGWNNNPSAKQFAYAYRTLLSRASVSGSAVANVTQQDYTDLLHLAPQEDEMEDQFEASTISSMSADHNYCTTALSLFVNNVLEYISGWIVRKLSPKVACADCLAALVVSADKSHHTDSLLEVKNNVGLVRPSNDVIAVVQQVERALRETTDVHRVRKDSQWDIVESKVLKRLPCNLFVDLQEHFRNTQHGIDSHYSDLVRNLCRTFLKLRRFHVVNLTNEELRGRVVRQTLTKTILFKNQ